MHFVVLLIIFSATSLIELAILIEVSRYLGTIGTILLVITTAFVGTSILKRQGLSTIANINESMRKHIAPVEPLVEGLLLVIAGALLLTPGIITDLLGLFLFIPPFRKCVVRFFFHKLLKLAAIHPHNNSSIKPNKHHEAEQYSDIIDAEYEHIDGSKKKATEG
ncbi:MAG: hypothetical protein TECD_01222 [Hyphomicrobiaceae bacterium hypho_1]